MSLEENRAVLLDEIGDLKELIHEMLMNLDPKCLEFDAANKHPNLVVIANKYLDHVEAKEYGDALIVYASLFNDVSATDDDCVDMIIAKDEASMDVAHMCLSYAMMLRQ
jgi:hypothetical protein